MSRIKDYQPQVIETALQQQWQEKKTYSVSEITEKDKFYCLAMFPYPSGNLHMGHVRNYTIADVIARYQRMLGKNVLQAIGWDAFGLPAENAAIKHNISPAKWTYENIATMKQQLRCLGFAYDWQREITTCDEKYYKWEQWLLIQLYKKGLLYRKQAVVNWDPVDKTVLANEQVVDGKGWRSGAKIERRKTQQWFLKITAYANELLADIKQLDWPNQVVSMQKNWIGKSSGTKIIFKTIDKIYNDIIVFTTRVDTLFGVTFIAIATEHPLAIQLAQKNSQIATFCNECKNIKTAEADLATIDKKGIDSGLKVIHPLTQEKISVWIVNYVLADYSYGAVMSVPAHDQRDLMFAQKYHLNIKEVIAYQDKQNNDEILINSQEFSHLDSQQARKKITAKLTKLKLGNTEIQYRLRDWGISRQRFWGTPLPFIHCKKCGIVASPILPVKLTTNHQRNPQDYQTTCPKCHSDATRDMDTLDTFIESAWYYARFACPQQHNKILDQKVNYWLPVDHYIGGIEHAVMHLLYARFINKVLRDLGLVQHDEPFKKLLTQGMVLNNGSKMSKSKGNTVSPISLLNKYGADTLRFFVIFAAPATQSLEWSDSGVEGSWRFINKVWRFFMQQQDIIKNKQYDLPNNLTADIKIYWQEINLLLQQASSDLNDSRLNTVASATMKLLIILQNVAKLSVSKVKNQVIYHGAKILLLILQVLTPHISTYLLKQLYNIKNIDDIKWPNVDLKACQADIIKMIIQINGKKRSIIEVAKNITQQELEKILLQDKTIQKFLLNKNIIKKIFVPQRMLNFVVRNE